MKGEKIKIHESILKNLYLKMGLSTCRIAKLFKCSPETIRRLMIKYNINRCKKKLHITKSELKELYWNKRLSTLEIAKKLGVSQSAVWKLMKKFKIKRRNANEYHKWKEVGNLIRPSLLPSPTLAYVIGVLVGDGYTYNRKHNYFIYLDSVERTFCEEFAKALKKLNLNPCLLKNKKKLVWRVVATSKIFYKWFNSLTIEKIKKLAMKYPREFLKGFYESEGCVLPDKNPPLVIVNTNKEIIDIAKRCLELLGFNPTLYPTYLPPPRKVQWRLNLCRKREIIRFINFINPYIKK
jgi:intein-encoded DNA endonuclease-like protein